MYLTSQHSRTKRNAYQGIVCECCYHGCNWFELQQYCGFRKKRNTEPDSISASSQNSGKLIDSVLNKWYKNIRILFWRWIYFYNRAFYEKKGWESRFTLLIFIFSSESLFYFSNFIFVSLYVWPWLCCKWRESNLFGRWIFKFIIVHSFRFM